MVMTSRRSVGLSLAAVLLLVGCTAATPSPRVSAPPASAQGSPSALSAAPSTPPESVTQAPSAPSGPVARDCPEREVRAGCWAELASAGVPLQEPDGDEVITDPYEDGPPMPYEPGTRVFVHDVAQDGGWWKVQVPLFGDRSGGDVFGWFRTEDLAPSDTPDCPAEASREALASLGQPDRLICFGDREIVVEGGVGGDVGDSGRITWGVEPPWFGDVEASAGRVATLFQGLMRSGDDPGLPVGVPDGAEPIEVGIYVRATGSFDHQAAQDCVRRLEQDPGAGEPIGEDPADSVLWCRQRFAVTAWEPIGGAEGRPYDGTIQLHRQPERGDEVFGCDTPGVPWNTFKIRIDPEALVHVWAEPDTGPINRYFIYWEPTFKGGTADDPVVYGPNGEVVAREGDVIDLDDHPNTIGGYRYCYSSFTVYDEKPE
jgi:hypothetical protein